MTNDPMRQKIAALLRPVRDGWSAEHSLDAQKGTIAQDSAIKPTRRRRHEYSPEIADLICDRIAGDFKISGRRPGAVQEHAAAAHASAAHRAAA